MLFVMTDSLDLQQLAPQTSQQLGPLVQVQPCPQSPWNPPDQQDPQKQDPQKQDPQKQDPHKQDPQKLDPQKPDPQKPDPQKPDLRDPLVPLDHLVQQPLNHLRA